MVGTYTRWATHGEPNWVNTHPQRSGPQNGRYPHPIGNTWIAQLGQYLPKGWASKQSWFNHTVCLQEFDRDQDWDMGEWVVWFYVERFTLLLNKERADTYCPHCFGSGPGPCPNTGHS